MITILSALVSLLSFGVRREAAPAVIGIFGQAPIDFKLVDPSKPPWRAV
jgi:hypothetical protein